MAAIARLSGVRGPWTVPQITLVARLRWQLLQAIPACCRCCCSSCAARRVRQRATAATCAQLRGQRQREEASSASQCRNKRIILAATCASQQDHQRCRRYCRQATASCDTGRRQSPQVPNWRPASSATAESLRWHFLHRAGT